MEKGKFIQKMKGKKSVTQGKLKFIVKMLKMQKLLR